MKMIKTVLLLIFLCSLYVAVNYFLYQDNDQQPKKHFDESINFVKLKAFYAFIVDYKKQTGDMPMTIKDMDKSIANNLVEAETLLRCQSYENPHTHRMEAWELVPGATLDELCVIATSKVIGEIPRQFHYELFSNGTIQLNSDIKP